MEYNNLSCNYFAKIIIYQGPVVIQDLARGIYRTGGQLVTLAGLRCWVGCPLCLAAALIHEVALSDIRVFECVVYIPAAALIILAAMLRM